MINSAGIDETYNGRVELTCFHRSSELVNGDNGDRNPLMQSSKYSLTFMYAVINKLTAVVKMVHYVTLISLTSLFLHKMIQILFRLHWNTTHTL